MSLFSHHLTTSPWIWSRLESYVCKWLCLTKGVGRPEFTCWEVAAESSRIILHNSAWVAMCVRRSIYNWVLDFFRSWWLLSQPARIVFYLGDQHPLIDASQPPAQGLIDGGHTGTHGYEIVCYTRRKQQEHFPRRRAEVWARGKWQQGGREVLGFIVLGDPTMVRVSVCTSVRIFLSWIPPPSSRQVAPNLFLLACPAVGQKRMREGSSLKAVSSQTSKMESHIFSWKTPTHPSRPSSYVPFSDEAR